jgi:PEGA domain-containing protein
MSDLRPFRQRRAAAAPAGPGAIDDARAVADSLSVVSEATALQPIEGDARLDFASEQDLASGAAIAVATAAPPATVPVRTAVRSPRSLVLVASALVVAAAAIAAALYGMMRPRTPPVPIVAAATLSIVSNPSDADVTIDGVMRGKTPLKISLAAGSYQMLVQQGTRTRTMPLTVEAGTVMSQYVELGDAAPTVGRLDISSDRAGAHVTIDGKPRGATPLTLTDIPPGRHTVSVSAGEANVVRTVDVTAGATASVMVALGDPGISAGWLSIAVPFEVQVSENGQVLGTSSADRIMIPAGKHTLDLQNAALEFATRQTVDVPPGKTAKLSIAVPNGSMSINALPWADVLIDGKPVGVTPLGRITVPIGSHEIVWRHPQLGERRRTVTVSAGAPVRIGMDLTK